MASQEYDSITVRTIRVAPPVPAYTALTSDGLGGTTWTTVSSPTAFLSAFQYICTPAKLYVADLSYNTISFNAGQGIKFLPTGLYSTTIIAAAFNEISVPGLSNLSSGEYTYGISTLNFSSIGNTIFTTDPKTNTLTYEIRRPTFKIGTTLLPINDYNSTITFIGEGDIFLSTFSTSYLVGFGISTFTSTGFSAMFSNISTLSTATVSTLSSLYVYKSTFSTIIPQLINPLLSTLSTLHSITNSTNILSTTIHASSLFSRYYLNIQSEVSSLSTSLHDMMINTTSTSITSTFGATTYVYNTSTIQNFVCTMNTLSSIIISTISNSYSSMNYSTTFAYVNTISSVITAYNTLSSGVSGLSFSTLSTLRTLPSTAMTAGGVQFSSFFTTMFKTFQHVSTINNRVEYKFLIPYTVNEGIQSTNGVQHDITLTTCQMNLAGLVPYIDTNSRVFIDYTPSYAFQKLATAKAGNSNGPEQFYLSSVVLYPVSTYIIHSETNTILSETVFSDILFFNSNNFNSGPPYSQLYNRTIRMNINPTTLLLAPNDTYTLNHYHSSIVNLNNVDLFINDPQANMFGGAVVPSAFTRDCDLNINTTVVWSNSMNRYNAVSAYINNGLFQNN